MFSEKWKTFLRGGRGGDNRETPSASALAKGAAFVPAKSNEEFTSRQSNGLDQFFASIRDQVGLNILDLGSASQHNISFITSLGHRIYSEDLLQAIRIAFPNGDQTNPEGIDQFIQNSFNFREFEFDGALVWDTLQILQPPLLQMVIDRLFQTLRPQASLLTMFNADEKAEYVPLYNYRIVSPNSVQMALRGHHRANQHFNNRSLERLFQRYGQVKFFLTRDNLREVLIKR